MEVKTFFRRGLDTLAPPLAAAVLGGAAWRSWQTFRETARTPESGEEHRPPKGWPSIPSVSVLVAAWNEAGHIGALIDSFEWLSYPSTELVICAEAAMGPTPWPSAGPASGCECCIRHQGRESKPPFAAATPTRVAR